MVVYEWFARFGKVLAPDPKHNDIIESFDDAIVEDSNKFSLWHILAPDPNFTNTTATSSTTTGSVTTSPATTVTSTSDGLHTPVDTNKGTKILESDKPPAPSYTPSPFRHASDNLSKSSSSALLLSSLQSPRIMKPYTNSDVEQQVVNAAKDRANAMTSPVLVLRTSVTAFRICKNNASINATVKKKLMDLLHNDASLISIRSSGAQYECPDGYTIFMTAAYANQIGAMEVIWEYCTTLDTENNSNNATTKQLLSSRNLEGKTVYHIAAERGHVEALQYILDKYYEIYGTSYDPTLDPPVDLMGHTPLGSVLLSPDLKAKQNKSILLEKLYHDNDASLVGKPLPVEQRIVPLSSTSKNKSNSNKNIHNHQSSNPIRAIAGMSEMPGKRVLMEDCTICYADDASMIIAVCDGHSDFGHISHYVAESFITGIKERLPTLLAGESSSNGHPNEVETATITSPESTSWEYVCTDLCLHIDEALESTTTLRGGSVAIFMIITSTKIVVANVGDCRCILVQSKLSSASTLNSDTDKNNADLLADQTEQLSLTSTVADASLSTEDGWMNKYEVQALSTDHKPNLPLEQERIKKNGLKVVGEKVNDQLTIHKICYKDDKLATSRAFGDFEYKSNNKFELHEQAVIALPEITIHRRKHDNDNDDKSNDQFLIAACDGVWDVMTNEEVGMFVTKRIEYYCNTSKEVIVDALILPIIADELIVECLHRGSEDNMSVVIVALSQMADRILFGNHHVVPPKVLNYDDTKGVV